MTVILKNEGKAEHTFTIGSLAIEKDLKPEQTTTVQVTLPETGPLRFHCKFHESMGMQGALYSVGGATPASSGASTTSSTVKSGY